MSFEIFSTGSELEGLWSRDWLRVKKNWRADVSMLSSSSKFDILSIN